MANSGISTPFVIVLNGQAWLVLNDGSWQIIIDDAAIPAGVDKYEITPEVIAQFNDDFYAPINDSYVKIPNEIVVSSNFEDLISNEIDLSPSHTANVSNSTVESSSDDPQGSFSFLGNISRTGLEVIATSGFSTNPIIEDALNELLGGSDENGFIIDVKPGDREASITIDVIETCSGTGDGEIFDFVGTVDDVEDGNTVVVVVTDQQGNFATFTTVIDEGTWAVNNADLTGLNDGELRVVAATVDNAGNRAAAATTFDKDTAADITITVDTGDDIVVNDEESTNVDMSGTVTDVEDGQTVTITVTDNTGNNVEFITTVNNGTWEVNDADLSSLNDGELTYTAEVTDQSCNDAIATITSDKDTQAQMTVLIDSGADEYLSEAELTPVHITGTVTDIEPGQPVTIVLSNPSGDTDTLTTIVQNDLTYSVTLDIHQYAPGILTAHASSYDVAGNPASAVDTAIIDIPPEITIMVDTTEDVVDNTINANEVAGVDISGTVKDVEDGQTITVTVFDGQSTLTFTTIVNGDTWAINNNDLSSLEDGDLTYTATVQNLVGNIATDSIIAEKDTIAEITIEVDTNEDVTDDTINANESTQVDIFGTVNDVEDGQTVHVKVTDGSTFLSFSTEVVNGEWKVNNADIASLSDTTITYTASVTDVAGNDASDAITSEKDTLAEITIAVNTNEDVIDDTLNAAEVGQVDISGTVNYVENGQRINVKVSDGSSVLTFSTTVNGSSWTINDADLTSLSDGTLTYTASVTDVAGNDASASITTEKDTLAEITVRIESGDDEFLILEEFTPVVVTGTVSNVEAGQIVNLTLTHANGSEDVTTALVQADLTYSAEVTLTDSSDGLLTVLAETVDQAGNPADATDTALIDQTAFITIEVNTNEDVVDNIINDAEEHAVDLFGTVTDVEDGQVITVGVSDGNHTLFFTTVVSGNTWEINDTNLSSLRDGTLTYTATVSDLAGNIATATTETEKDTLDVITVNIDSGDDEFLSAAETSSVTISGFALLIEAGQIVTLTVRNLLGDVAEVTAVVQANLRYSTTVDLSGFADGEIAVIASAIDVAGNPAQAYDLANIDQTAVITIEVNTNEDITDNIINANEVVAVDISGTITDIEDGQVITLDITDGTTTLTFTTNVNGDTWQVDDVDLSSLAEGTLTYTASVIDVAGNPAQAVTTTEKDTLAEVTLVVDTNANLADNTLNAAEIAQVDISGTVTNVDDGQTITIIITDGTDTLTFNTLVSGNTWAINDTDLTALAEGTLTYTATVTDIAGNVATDTLTTEKDTLAAITVHIESGDDEALIFDEFTPVVITGAVENIEAGQTVNLTITHSDGDIDTTTAIVQNDFSYTASLTLTNSADGTISVLAEVVDIAGNPAQATDDATIDQTASITISVNTNEDVVDNIINEQEQFAVDISGTVADVEDGQIITVEVTDGDLVLSFTTEVNGNTWEINDNNLSSLRDGTLSYTATVEDWAGNVATDTVDTEKDTLDVISIKIDSGDDEYLAADETNPVKISGLALLIEAGQTINIEIKNLTGDIITTTAVVQNNFQYETTVDLSGFADGFIIATATAIDQAGNTAQASDTANIDQTAEITIVVDTNADVIDNIINANEVTAVDISGTVTDVEDDQEVTLLVTDGTDTLTFTTLVSDGTWLVEDADLTALADGELTYTASVSDSLGNFAEASTTSEKDTLATITIEVDTNADVTDNTLNAAEVTQVDISGTVINVDDGSLITVEVTDGSDVLTFTTSVSGDTWLISANDLSALDDGTLDYTVSVTDLAGNLATADTTTEKDTRARVTINIDTNADIEDDILNPNEVGQVDISGTIFNVENGQTINVSVTDGTTTLTYSTLVSGIIWSIDGQDFSSLADGTITYTATVTDVAGNTATDSDTAIIDTFTTIDIDTGATGLNTAELRANQISEISGTTDAEAGQEVTLEITDGSEIKSFTGLVAAGGVWTVSDIDVANLSTSNTWEVTASVYDLAGNYAIDDMPTIDVPGTNEVSEVILGFTGSDASSHQVDINNATLTLASAANQTELELLTSFTSSVTVTVAGDGQSLSVTRDSDDAELLTVELLIDTISVKLLGDFDQFDEKTLETTVFIEALQTDADGTTELVILPSYIDIIDSPPFAINDNYTVTEGETTYGSLTGNDFTNEGPLSVVSFEYEGATYTIPPDGSETISLSYGDLTIDDNGAWVFVASRNLDNSLVQAFEITYTAEENDGGQSEAVATFTIEDGIAGSMENSFISTVEPINEVATQTSIDFDLIAGSDALLPETISFIPNAFYNLISQQITSNGIDINYTFEDDGQNIIALAGSLTVFTVTLSAISNGDDLLATLVYEQFEPIDHINVNTLELLSSIIATDIDGTQISKGDVSLIISDGEKPIFSNISTVTLDENLLQSGEQVATGKMSTIVGSDDIVSVEFLKASKQPILTDEGVNITYDISADGKTLTGYIGDINDPHFVAVLSDSFNNNTDTIDEDYQFTLFKTLDQDVTDSIPLKIKVTDYDGDSSQNHLKITIIDDTTAALTTPDLVVSELPRDVNNTLEDNVDLGNITIQVGQDSLAGIDYEVTNGAAVLDSNGDALTQNGQTIFWQNSNNGILKGSLSSGEAIFQVTFMDDFDPDAVTMSIRFKLYGPVDHLDPQDDNLNILVPIVLIDQDGSRTVENMNVEIYDGINPEIDTSGTADLVDEGLLITEESVVVEGSYRIDKGSDTVVSVAIAEGFTLSGVSTRGGINVSLADTPDGDNWYSATADDNDSEVFRIRFNADGSYEYEQFFALDHADGNGENQLTLNFDVQAIDADGDRSSDQSVTVDVKDDIPLTDDVSVSFTEGDDVVVKLLSTTNEGADGAVVTKVTYQGDDYLPGDTITLEDDDDVEYGTLVVEANGTATIISETFLSDVDSYTDLVTTEITDSDNDVVTKDFNITIKDSSGTIIKIDPETDEDTPVSLLIVANPGDNDQNEVITEIRINIASLNGGTLTLDGATPTVDGADYLIDINDTIPSAVVPDGDLVFTPALNESDAIDGQEVDIRVDVTVNSDNGDNTVENTIHVTVNSVADLPEWDDGYSTYEYNAAFDGSVVEDGGATPLTLRANLTDTDTSEKITYRIENIDEDLILTTSDGSTKTLSNGDIISKAELATLSATTVQDSAGLMTFDLIAIATEKDNGDTIEQVAKTITLNVQPVSDTPELSVKSIVSDEDVPINLNDVIIGLESDIDGSEVLSAELTVPDGWSLLGLNGAVVSDLGGNVWLAQGLDIIADNVQLIPKQDLSSVVGSAIVPTEIGVVGISMDTDADGVPVFGTESRTASEILAVTLKGIVDIPTIDVNADWDMNYDAVDKVFTISHSTDVIEDNNAPLDFHVITSDIDGSEIISITINSFEPGFTLVDGAGDEVTLEVVEAINNKPVFSISADDLQNLFLKPPEDYSGKTSFDLTVISTEPDGDSGEFNVTVEIVYSPVIDETALLLETSTTGIEDLATAIPFKSPLTEDNDGSEIITGAVITSIPVGVILSLDGAEIDSSGDVDLLTLANDLGVPLEIFLASNRLAIVPPEDATGTYQVGIDYTVVDTSDEGDSAPQTFSTTADITVTAEVDKLTRFDTPDNTLVSGDGSPIDLTGQVSFTDDDIDGSEVLDYIVLIMPSGDGWTVTHPDGALPDGDGRWYIPIDSGLTADNVQENDVDVLADVLIYSEEVTPSPVTIQVAGRVTDITDHEMKVSDFTVQFDVAAPNSTASAVEMLQLTPIDGIEDQTVDFAGHLDNDIAGDANDEISFRVLASDLPEGVSLTGTGVLVMYDASGKNVYQYLFDETALADLSISSAGENFAGILDIPIRIIALDSVSGDTLIDDSQILELDITPVVDGVDFMAEVFPIEEDTALPLLVQFDFLDQDLLPSSGGQEQVLIDESDVNNNLTITLLDGGTLIDTSGYFVLKDGTTDTYQFTGTTQAQLQISLALVAFLPTEHLSGEDIIRVQLSGSIVDTALMLAGEVSDTAPFSNIVDIDITPVTDNAALVADDVQGDEDSIIDLSSLSGSLIDQDGSETISFVISGVPTGAVIGTYNGTTFTQLINNGVDGGSFNGEPTFSWSLAEEDFDTLALLPSLDFHGEIPLELQAVTKDEDPAVYVTTVAEFIVGVNPVGDGADVFTEPESNYEGDEDSGITIDLGAFDTDTVNDELMQITVKIASSSDASALVGITDDASIRVGLISEGFTDDGAGGFTATLTTDRNEIESFTFHAGSLAWGTFDMSVDISSVDSDVINGNTVTDVSDAQTFNFIVELTPEVDAPLWVEVDDVLTNDPNNVPLGLEIALQNPAVNEEGFLRVEGLDASMTLNAGTKEGNDWIVAFDDIATLEVLGASDGDNFELILTPFAELDGATEDGATETITVDIDVSNPAPTSSPIVNLLFEADVMSNSDAQHVAVNNDSQFINQVLDEMNQANSQIEHL